MRWTNGAGHQPNLCIATCLRWRRKHVRAGLAYTQKTKDGGGGELLVVAPSKESCLPEFHNRTHIFRTSIPSKCVPLSQRRTTMSVRQKVPYRDIHRRVERSPSSRKRTPSKYGISPFFCITCRNLTTTFEQGRMSTCRFPRFSALEMVFRVSASTPMRTIYAKKRQT